MKKIKIALIGLEQDMILELKRNNHKILGYFSNKKQKSSLKFLGNFKNTQNFLKNNNCKICIAMGPINRRKKFFKEFRKNLLTYISDKSIISKTSKIMDGSFVQSNCFIGEKVIQTLSPIDIGCFSIP